MTDPLEVEQKVPVYLYLLAIALPVTAWDAWVLNILLGWFLPELPHVKLWRLAGILFLLRTVFRKDSKLPPKTWKWAIEVTTNAVLEPLLVLIIGGILHLLAS
jgi:hypothetical protein